MVPRTGARILDCIELSLKFADVEFTCQYSNYKIFIATVNPIEFY